MNLNYSLVSVLAATVVGLVLVLWPDVAVDYLIISVGIVFFMLPGLFTLAQCVFSGTVHRKHLLLMAAGSLFFGLFLVIKPGFFADILMILLGLLLVLEGVQQLVALFRLHKGLHRKLSLYHAVLPVAVLGVGVFSLFSPAQTRDTVLTIIGFANLFYAFFESYLWFRYKRNRQGSKLRADITDAEIIENDK